MKFNIEVPEDVQSIFRLLESHGYEAYMVGGCVRDSMLGISPHDYDICTSAKPDEIMEVFKRNKIVLTGLKHGTVTVVLSEKPCDITTYRIDGKYSDGRRPDAVAFTDSLIEDLRRRDFTINAMAYNPKTGLIDPFGGQEDIVEKVIRCVGSASDRFTEDALRILRAIRFSAQLDFDIHPMTAMEIHRRYKRLENVSSERINSEFCKIAISKRFYEELSSYKDVFSFIIPELEDMIGFDQKNPNHEYDAFSHTVHAIEACESDDLTVRLAVLFHDIGKPHSYQDSQDGIRHFKGHSKVGADITDGIMRRLKFDNRTREDVTQLVYYHDSEIAYGRKYINRWLRKIGEEQFRRLLAVKKADLKGHRELYDAVAVSMLNMKEELLGIILSEEPCFSVKDLAVNGNDVMNIMQIKEGKEVGYWLNMILDMVINGEIENDRGEIIHWLTGMSLGFEAP